MKKHVIIVLIAVFTLASNVFAQDVERPETYNYIRGIESIENNDYQSALDYLNKEVEENPKNGYAYAWIALIRQQYEEYGNAITNLDLAIKYIPKKDKTYCSWVYVTMSQVYQSLDQYEKAIDCINQAVKIDPEDTDVYDKRAQLYYELEKYDESDNDYKKMISLKPGDVMGYMGLGRNEKMRKNYASAIKQFDYVIKLACDYPSGYSFRGECFLALKNYKAAADDIVRALQINRDNKAFYHMQELADSSLISIVIKLKVQATKEPTESAWPYYLGVVYERNNNYKKALDNYIEAYRLDNNPIIAKRVSGCYDYCGIYTEALKYINMGIQIDSTDADFYRIRALIYDDMGNTNAAINDWNKYISLEPESFFGYYRRGWVKDHTGDVEGAIEDYTTSIELEPEYTYSYINRGVLYQLNGNMELAKKDFETEIAKDSVQEESHTVYALFHLGRIEEAKELIQKILAKEESSGNCYEAACLYSLAGDTQNSLKYLRKSIEKGKRDFNHIRRDRDLKNIRLTSEFNTMMKCFEEKYKKEVSDISFEPNIKGSEKIVEVPFTKDGEVYKVQCNINNLPLHFIFDTGASDVSISNVEASFMMKNQYLLPSDVIGKQNYMTADGDIIEGTIINLRSVDFGGLHLENIKASVVKNQKAPLLLGQSILNRLGKIEIDNISRKIQVTYKE